MENLIDAARKFLADNPDFNEIELSDNFHKVKIVRCTSLPGIYTTAPYTYQYQCHYDPYFYRYNYEPPGCTHKLYDNLKERR